MEVELGPFPQFEQVRSNAYWSRAHIDTRFAPDDGSIETYKTHLKDCYNHPTSGMLAKRKYIDKRPMDYPLCARYNKSVMEMHPEVKALKKSFENEMKKLYPKTRFARQYIIDKDRIMFDCVEHSKKYSIWNKIAIFCRRFV